MCFLRNRSSYSFETCTIAISTPENLRVHWVWLSKYKGNWYFSPKCVFSEMDHQTDLKLVPLWSACLKTSGCTEFDTLNTKESDSLAQNVFSQKWIIKQIWNLYPCDRHGWKLHGQWWISPRVRKIAKMGNKVQKMKIIVDKLYEVHSSLATLRIPFSHNWTLSRKPPVKKGWVSFRRDVSGKSPKMGQYT